MPTPYSKYLTDARKAAQTVQGAPGSQIKYDAFSFSEKFGYKRLGVHYVRLPAGCRTSLPHAESLEEEFVYVISGRPHAWVDGYVYELKAGCAAGFPAGTGVAHTFINNTSEDVELLVLGERTKKENRCSFPVNPEQKETCGIWWVDAPKRELGPHSGRPGPLRPGDVGQKWPSCLTDCTQQEMTRGWRYPGYSEQHGDFVRLTDTLKLKALGLGYELLPPGRRTSFPHAHEREEEFLFVLCGRATVWMNGFAEEAGPGTGCAWPAGTGVAHCVINDSEEPLIYFVAGEASEKNLEDRYFYPLDPSRNEAIRAQGKLWESPPRDLPFGSHDGRPRQMPNL